MPRCLDRYALTTKREPFNGSHLGRKRTGESQKSTAAFPHPYFSARLMRFTWPRRVKMTFDTFIQTTRTFWLPRNISELKGKTQSVGLPRLGSSASVCGAKFHPPFQPRLRNIVQPEKICGSVRHRLNIVLVLSAHRQPMLWRRRRMGSGRITACFPLGYWCVPFLPCQRRTQFSCRLSIAGVPDQTNSGSFVLALRSRHWNERVHPVESFTGAAGRLG